MHPSSLLSYYPTYALLDEIMSKNDYKTLNLFFDLKNNLQSTYMEHAIVNIVNSSKKAKTLDTSIFSSVVSFLSFHKMWATKRAADINFFIFFETGHSYYHKNISKTYKISRKIDDLYGLDREDRELFFRVLHANFQLIERAFNLMPKIKVIRLNHLEADFVPYYLITRNMVEASPNHANVIYSNDHDLYQCLNDNTYVFAKAGRVKKILQKGEIMQTFLKRNSNIPEEYYPLAMAIIGDIGDDVIGVKDVGPARFIDVFPTLVELTGDMETIYQKIKSKTPLFNPLSDKIQNKILKKIIDAESTKQKITKNLKLVSFELLSRELDDPSDTQMIERLELIKKTLNDNRYVPCENMKQELIKTGVMLEQASIDFLYL